MFSISYREILGAFRRGLRTGSWHKLSKLKKALYKAALKYARIKGKIVNPKLTNKIKTLIQKLVNPIKTKIWENGLKKAKQMEKTFQENNVFKWCPKIKKWLKNQNYILWLGTNTQLSYRTKYS